ncbi:MAG: exosortase/archaeosortase family protein, partial [Proteobacteria bacterium]|nr:exosortase/archaeosortase family protein [Pseudomonadota bacterium]
MIFYLLPFILIFYLFFPTIAETFEICYVNEDYSHGLILPLICLYFLYLDKQKIFSEIKNTHNVYFSWTGLALLTCGIIFFILGEISNLLFLRWFALYPTFLGTFILVFGKKLFYLIAGPFVLIFMSKPLPDSLIPKIFFPLQVLSAKVSAKVLEVLGVPVYLKGNIIEIPGMQLMVEEACSGLRSVMALLTVSLI